LNPKSKRRREKAKGNLPGGTQPVRHSVTCDLSLTPGFSPVLSEGQTKAVSTAWPVREVTPWRQTVETVFPFLPVHHPAEAGC
jgi:hypothetical protein